MWELGMIWGKPRLAGLNRSGGLSDDVHIGLSTCSSNNATTKHL